MPRKRQPQTCGLPAYADCQFCHREASVDLKTRTCLHCLTTVPDGPVLKREGVRAPADSLVAKREIVPSY